MKVHSLRVDVTLALRATAGQHPTRLIDDTIFLAPKASQRAAPAEDRRAAGRASRSPSCNRWPLKRSLDAARRHLSRDSVWHLIIGLFGHPTPDCVTCSGTLL